MVNGETMSMGSLGMGIDTARDRLELRVGVAHVWWIDLDEAGGSPTPETILPPEELTRARRFRFPHDARRFLAMRAATRRVLARYLGADPRELRFDRTCKHCGAGHGKPVLACPVEVGLQAGLDFSVSRSGSLGAVAAARGVTIGVDVESARAPIALDGLIRRVLTEDEVHEFRRTPSTRRHLAFLQRWTSKEAVLKATGHGLAIDPRSLVVAVEPGGALCLAEAGHVRAEEWKLVPLDPDPDHVATLAVHAPDLDVHTFIWRPHA
jgi:4'-phosphopantetheinyl transferase